MPKKKSAKKAMPFMANKKVNPFAKAGAKKSSAKAGKGSKAPPFGKKATKKKAR